MCGSNSTPIQHKITEHVLLRQELLLDSLPHHSALPQLLASLQAKPLAQSVDSTVASRVYVLSACPRHSAELVYAQSCCLVAHPSPLGLYLVRGRAGTPPEGEQESDWLVLCAPTDALDLAHQGYQFVTTEKPTASNQGATSGDSSSRPALQCFGQVSSEDLIGAQVRCLLTGQPYPEVYILPQLGPGIKRLGFSVGAPGALPSHEFIYQVIRQGLPANVHLGMVRPTFFPACELEPANQPTNQPIAASSCRFRCARLLCLLGLLEGGH
jgi:hypothetical protein